MTDAQRTILAAMAAVAVIAFAWSMATLAGQNWSKEEATEASARSRRTR